MAEEDSGAGSAEPIAVNYKALYSGPAFYCNRTFATRQPLGLRLTFMETNAELEDDEFRTAVFLQLHDALALKDLLERVLGDVKVETEIIEKTDE